MSLTIRCPGCQYEVTHTQETRCPECGTDFDREKLRTDEEVRVQRQRESGVALLGISVAIACFVVGGLALGGAMSASGAGIILIVPALGAIPIPYALAIKVARYGPPMARKLAWALLAVYFSPLALPVLALIPRACSC